MNALRRVIDSPSKWPGGSGLWLGAVAGAVGLSIVVSHASGAQFIRSARAGEAPRPRLQQLVLAAPTGSWPPVADAAPELVEGARSPRRFGMELGREADQVGELGDRLEVAERGEALEAERVEVVAREQGEVGIGGRAQDRGSP